MSPFEEVPLAARGRVRHRPRVFGGTRDGLPLLAYGPEAPGTPLVFAAIHGNETETTVALSAALRATPPAALRCMVVLVANPDGMLRGTRGNAAGVDLNRNFPARDWARGVVRSRWSSETPQVVELGTGAAAGSEPEVRALMGLIERLRPAFALALHAPIGVVLETEPSPLGRALGERGGLPRKAKVDYATSGVFDAWARERGVPALTLELPRTTNDEAIRRWSPLLGAVLRRSLEGS
jgi:protein MpaA